jgi:hypothetical protein
MPSLVFIGVCDWKDIIFDSEISGSGSHFILETKKSVKNHQEVFLPRFCWTKAEFKNSFEIFITEYQ